MNTRRFTRLARTVGVLLLVAMPSLATAQILSNTASVNLEATLAQSLTISVTSGSSVNFTLTNGAAAAGDVPVVVETSWNIVPLLIGEIKLYGYFGTPSQALADGEGNYITSGLVEGRVTTGTPVSYTAFTQTGPVGPAGGSLALYSQLVTILNMVGSRSDNLDLQINLTGQSIPAGTYQGVLTLQARAS